MALSKKKVETLYQSGAKHYDLTVWLYRLIGFRIKTYRTHAVELLRLKRGDCVVEFGCGTGLNFPLIMKRIGPQGRLIGVDLTSGMLEYARKKIEAAGWKNVELVQSDIAKYKFPKTINAVLSTGVFGYVSEYDQVIKTAAQAIVPGGRMVIFDSKRPKRLPLWILKLFVFLGRSFGLTLDYFNVRPWASMKHYFQDVKLKENYGGIVYTLSGIAPSHGKSHKVG